MSVCFVCLQKHSHLLSVDLAFLDDLADLKQKLDQLNATLVEPTTGDTSAPSASTTVDNTPDPIEVDSEPVDTPVEKSPAATPANTMDDDMSGARDFSKEFDDEFNTIMAERAAL